MNFNIAIFISGRGSNMESIVKFIQESHRLGKHLNASIVTVISDKKDSQGLRTAKNLGIKSKYLNPGKFKSKLEGKEEYRYINYLIKKKINLICLAGFMRILKPRLLTCFKNRIINIHPSLLPKYPGLHTHKRVLAEGQKTTGCTLHLVDKGVDTGKILIQKKIIIHPNDDVKTLSMKVIKKEYLAYKEGLEKIFLKKILLN